MEGLYTRNYQEVEVVTADPIELIRILYRTAIEAIEEAVSLLEAGDAGGRAQAVSRAQEVLLELIGAVDVEAGGELAGKLLQLYDYVNYELLQGHARQSREAFERALRVLKILYEAWQQIDYQQCLKQLEEQFSAGAERISDAGQAGGTEGIG